MHAAKAPHRAVDVYFLRKLAKKCVLDFVEVEVLRKQLIFSLDVIILDEGTHMVEYLLMRAHRLVHEVLFVVDIIGIAERPVLCLEFITAHLHDIGHEANSVGEAVILSQVRMLLLVLSEATGAGQRPSFRQAELAVQRSQRRRV